MERRSAIWALNEEIGMSLVHLRERLIADRYKSELMGKNEDLIQEAERGMLGGVGCGGVSLWLPNICGYQLRGHRNELDCRVIEQEGGLSSQGSSGSSSAQVEAARYAA
ncbi:MAG TPA: hypothetical protein VGW39_11420 [Chthoniobacterales bacterium]|nr:hypothetical protein [Chthoniobacterales bacterium]